MPIKKKAKKKVTKKVTKKVAKVVVVVEEVEANVAPLPAEAKDNHRPPKGTPRAIDRRRG
jgi:hypothetical protein